MVKHRNIILVYVFSIITLGIYAIYWIVSTKNEMNKDFGAEIPSAWMLLFPLINIGWSYKYHEEFALKVKKDNHRILWFVLSFFVIIMPAIIQSELNKIATPGTTVTQTTKTIPVEPQQKPIAVQPTQPVTA